MAPIRRARFSRSKQEEPEAPAEQIVSPANLLYAAKSEEDAEDIVMQMQQDLSPKWLIEIDGLGPVDSLGAKFSVFTPGESSTGQIVVIALAKPGVNRSLLSWVSCPVEKRVSITITGPEGSLIEKWSMVASPVAMAMEDLSAESPEPWSTTLQLSIRELVIR